MDVQKRIASMLASLSKPTADKEPTDKAVNAVSIDCTPGPLSKVDIQWLKDLTPPILYNTKCARIATEVVLAQLLKKRDAGPLSVKEKQLVIMWSQRLQEDVARLARVTVSWS